MLRHDELFWNMSPTVTQYTSSYISYKLGVPCIHHLSIIFRILYQAVLVKIKLLHNWATYKKKILIIIILKVMLHSINMYRNKTWKHKTSHSDIPCLVCTSCGWRLKDSHHYCSVVDLVMQELWLSNLMLCKRHSVQELDSAKKLKTEVEIKVVFSLSNFIWKEHMKEMHQPMGGLTDLMSILRETRQMQQS